jgi:hypothetical protein
MESNAKQGSAPPVHDDRSTVPADMPPPPGLGSPFAALWDDIDNGNTFVDLKPLLAHYTTVSTLESILTNKQLWLSNPLYMNDFEEMRFGMITGERMLRERAPAIDEAIGDNDLQMLFWTFFGDDFRIHSNEYTLDTYLTCFSRHLPHDTDGLLSMWRAYGNAGNGVAIVFDTSRLIDTESAALVLVEVDYQSRERRMEWISGLIDRFIAILKNSALDPEIVKFAGRAFLSRLKGFSLLTKHPGFREEREWRLVYFPEHDVDARLVPQYGYALTERGVEPKLKLNLDGTSGVTQPDFAFDSLVHSIIAGPSISSPLAVASLKRMLEKIGRPHLANLVVPSDIPFRSRW